MLAHDPVLLVLLSITLKSAFVSKELNDFKGFGNRRDDKIQEIGIVQTIHHRDK